MIHNRSCRILENKQIDKSPYFIVSILSKEIGTDSKPGQFVMLGLDDAADLFLRRPYSVCGTWKMFKGSEKHTFQLLYKVVGKGTHALSKACSGDEVTILGPLGNPFSLDIARSSDAEHIIIAGGIGSAPFPLLVHSLNMLGIRPVMFYGGRNTKDLPLKSWFKKYCSRVLVSTEDGSEGKKGLITDLFEQYAEGRPTQCIVYACGPIGMLRKIAAITEKKGFSAYGSFEERMACGFGVCLGCAIPVKTDRTDKRYEHVCVDGPVFDMNRVDFDRT